MDNNKINERPDNDLVELVLQLHCRSSHFPSEEVNKNYITSKEELFNRLKNSKMSLSKLDLKILNTIKQKIELFETCKNENFYGSMYQIIKENLGDSADSKHSKIMDTLSENYNSRKRNLDEAISWIDALLEQNKEVK